MLIETLYMIEMIYLEPRYRSDYVLDSSLLSIVNYCGILVASVVSDAQGCTPYIFIQTFRP